MLVSREYAMQELRTAAETLGAWLRELDNPAEALPGGGERPFYPDGVPQGLSVDDVDGIPAGQLRAELLALAGKLEALASF